MLKRLIIVLCICLFCLAISSCMQKDNESAEYKCFVTDISNCIGPPIKKEFEFWNDDTYVKDTETDSQIIKFNNTEYMGRYVESSVRMFNNYPTDYYECESGIEFGVNSETKELVSISFMSHEFFDTIPYLDDVSNLEEYCKNLATQYASQFIDVSEYKLFKEEHTINNYTKDGKDYQITYYIYDYIKFIDDIRTSDWIRIQVTSKGILASISMGSVGAFNNKKIDFSLTSCQTSIDTKVKSLIGTDLVSYDIDDKILAYNMNGELILSTTINVKLQNEMTTSFVLAVLLG